MLCLWVEMRDSCDPGGGIGWLTAADRSESNSGTLQICDSLQLISLANDRQSPWHAPEPFAAAMETVGGYGVANYANLKSGG